MHPFETNSLDDSFAGERASRACRIPAIPVDIPAELVSIDPSSEGCAESVLGSVRCEHSLVSNVEPEFENGLFMMFENRPRQC